MKTNYSGVLMILSTIVLSACGSSTQGAGANADGSCNDSVKGAAQTLVSSLGTAQTNLLNDQNPDGTYKNYGDVVTQLQSAKQACDAFVGTYGTTVCTVTDQNGNSQTLDAKKVVQACAQVSSFSTTCDSNYIASFEDISKSAQPLSLYLNSDGTLSSLATTDPTGFASAASGLNSSCTNFESKYSTQSCTIVSGGKTIPLDSTSVNTLCAAVKSALANPNPNGFASFNNSIGNSLSEIKNNQGLQVIDAVNAVQASVKGLHL